jgi:hypothetical protein
VGFYSDDRFLLDHVTEFIGTALKNGSGAIVVATDSHRNGLLSRLQGYGVDVIQAIEHGRYLELDAAEILAAFMVDGKPDASRVLALFGNLTLMTAKGAKKGRISRCRFRRMRGSPVCTR